MAMDSALGRIPVFITPPQNCAAGKSLETFVSLAVDLVPAMVHAVFFFTPPEQFQSAGRLRMRASNQDGAEERNGRDVGASERGTGDGGKAGFVADTRDGSGFAIGDAEGADALFAGALRGFDSVSQALAKADGDEEIARIERAHATLDIAGAADRSFGGEAESH